MASTLPSPSVSLSSSPHAAYAAYIYGFLHKFNFLSRTLPGIAWTPHAAHRLHHQPIELIPTLTNRPPALWWPRSIFRQRARHTPVVGTDSGTMGRHVSVVGHDSGTIYPNFIVTPPWPLPLDMDKMAIVLQQQLNHPGNDITEQLTH